MASRPTALPLSYAPIGDETEVFSLLIRKGVLLDLPFPIEDVNVVQSTTSIEHATHSPH